MLQMRKYIKFLLKFNKLKLFAGKYSTARLSHLAEL